VGLHSTSEDNDPHEGSWLKSIFDLPLLSPDQEGDAFREVTSIVSSRKLMTLLSLVNKANVFHNFS